MTYWTLNALFLAPVLVVLVVAAVVVRRRPAEARRGILGAFGVSLGVLLVLTALFDNVMIAIGLVGYDEGLISGAFLGIAPLEDFAYAVAAVLLLPSLWLLLGARDTKGSER
ncbi:lycopene cyclase domain-containing protein [Herbiconiux sp. KACC 21604]|uniref:lycopene cyclase domain-containing protein n=1 Tax=unclassified Herbiconiux TaxID=2618217 RepID=UPI001491F18D|nr:lycopene cyclase domain-containing protein [Herbiconiux sp. SALV-R1]QJU55409.1 lycopene cyclase domain-containing protein [Herbiconiux sp. SALV-R1]WPO86584.1 lycopene cyclase domain-containing protein [Herbiconiux sp. KACC 21604]